MPTFEITSPDGTRYRVTGPEGATEAEALAQVRQQQRAPTANEQQLASGGSRFMQGMRDPLDAGAQLLTKALPEGVVSGVNRATQYVNELPGIGPVTKALGMTPATPGQIDAGIAGREQALQGARSATGQEGIDWARLGGNVATTAPLAFAAPGAMAPSMGARVASGMTSGGMMGALQPVTENQEDFWGQKGAQTATGMASGGIAAPAAGALARVISPNTRPQVRTLMNEGVTPTPGQILGGVAQRTEEKMTSMPILGDAIASGQRRGVEELNRAAYARALNPIGGKAPQEVGREGVAEVSGQLSKAYNDLLPKLSFKADPQFSAELGNVMKMAGTLPAERAQQVERIIREQVVGKLTPQGLASGATVKEIESELGRVASRYRGSAIGDERQVGAAVQEVQAAIRRTLERSNPQEAQELAAINQAYSQYTRIRDAASRQGSREGVFTPAQLAAAVRSGDRSVGKGNYARGTANMQDLSDAAVNVLGTKYPDSGSVGRLLMGGGTLGAGLVEPTIPAAFGAASLPYLPGGRQLMAAILARRPELAQPVAQGVRQGAPLLTSGAVPFGYQISGN